jgi:hypothetical protein
MCRTDITGLNVLATPSGNNLSLNCVHLTLENICLAWWGWPCKWGKTGITQKSPLASGHCQSLQLVIAKTLKISTTKISYIYTLELSFLILCVETVFDSHELFTCLIQACPLVGPSMPASLLVHCQWHQLVQLIRWAAQSTLYLTSPFHDV